jgi:hypothetical protein
MISEQFFELTRSLFGSVLTHCGFTCEKSAHSVFTRSSGVVVHVIGPDLGRGQGWYDVKVFPTSPLIDPLFHDRFPDGLSFPTGDFHLLSEEGVGSRQQQFSAKHEEVVKDGFHRRVKPLLENYAVPYFDRLQSVSDLIPLI